MAKIFKPRRGKKSTMAGTKKTTVLSAGEMFIEVPDTGAGTGHSKMKIGDGSTQYSSLPYAMGDTENDKIAFSNDTSGNITTALNKVTSGAALKTMIAALKQAVSLANTSITQLNDETNNINIYVGEDGKLHFVDKDGADTVLNFSSGSGKASTIFYLLVHDDGITGDVRLPLTEVTYNPDNAGSLAKNGILKIVDNNDFSINSNHIMTANRNGTMTIIGQLGSNGGSYHYDKMVNSTRTRLVNQYGHYYDITELKQGDTIYFVYNNTQAYWYTGSAAIIFQ